MHPRSSNLTFELNFKSFYAILQAIWRASRFVSARAKFMDDEGRLVIHRAQHNVCVCVCQCVYIKCSQPSLIHAFIESISSLFWWCSITKSMLPMMATRANRHNPNASLKYRKLLLSIKCIFNAVSVKSCLHDSTNSFYFCTISEPSRVTPMVDSTLWLETLKISI